LEIIETMIFENRLIRVCTNGQKIVRLNFSPFFGIAEHLRVPTRNLKLNCLLPD